MNHPHSNNHGTPFSKSDARLWDQDLHSLFMDIESEDDEMIDNNAEIESKNDSPTNLEQIRQQLERAQHAFRRHVLAVFRYAQGMCTDPRTRELALRAQAKALSRGTIGDIPEDVLVDEAPYLEETFLLEAMVQSVINDKKSANDGHPHIGMRIGKASLSDELNEIRHLQQELRKQSV